MTYYSIQESTLFEGKEDLAGTYYKSLAPRVQKIPGFLGDAFFGSPHNTRAGLNVATWTSGDAVKEWRNESKHLSVQGKGSEDVLESYRLRLGPESQNMESTGVDDFKQTALIFYRENRNVEGTPEDNIFSVFPDELVADWKKDLLDSAVFQGPQTLWLTGWSSGSSAVSFEKTMPRLEGDRVVRVSVQRDYTKFDRKDAPSEIAGKDSIL